MKFSGRRHTERMLSVEITPMIDVVFLLIVFFLATAQIARMTRAQVNLPQEAGMQSPHPDDPGLIVNIQADGVILVSEREMSFEELRRAVQQEISQQADGRAERVKLLLRADRDLPAGRLNEVVSLLQELGVGVGRFATEPPR